MHFCAIGTLLSPTNTSPRIHTVHDVFYRVWLDTYSVTTFSFTSLPPLSPFLSFRCIVYTYYSIWALAMQHAHGKNFKLHFFLTTCRGHHGLFFSELLDIEFSLGFCYPICGTNNVNTIVCDGTSLAF